MPGITTPQLFKKALNTEQLHIKAVIGTDTCKLIVDTAQVYSERTGELLSISSNRFRYTTGTRAAREGFGEMVNPAGEAVETHCASCPSEPGELKASYEVCGRVWGFFVVAL